MCDLSLPKHTAHIPHLGDWYTSIVSSYVSQKPSLHTSPSPYIHSITKSCPFTLLSIFWNLFTSFQLNFSHFPDQLRVSLTIQHLPLPPINNPFLVLESESFFQKTSLIMSTLGVKWLFIFLKIQTAGRGGSRL